QRLKRPKLRQRLKQPKLRQRLKAGKKLNSFYGSGNARAASFVRVLNMAASKRPYSRKTSVGDLSGRQRSSDRTEKEMHPDRLVPWVLAAGTNGKKLPLFIKHKNPLEED